MWSNRSSRGVRRSHHVLAFASPPLLFSSYSCQSPFLFRGRRSYMYPYRTWVVPYPSLCVRMCDKETLQVGSVWFWFCSGEALATYPELCRHSTCLISFLVMYQISAWPMCYLITSIPEMVSHGFRQADMIRYVLAPLNISIDLDRSFPSVLLASESKCCCPWGFIGLHTMRC